MKKKVIVGLTAVILLAATSTAIYADYLNEQKTVEQSLKQLETESLNIEDNFYCDPMFEWLYSQYSDSEKREYLIEEYAYTKFFHHMTDVESAYLYKLAQEGKDFYELLRVYSFWKTTTEPMEMIASIYDKYPDEPDANWEYKEYMKLTDKEDEILTNDEIDSYLESGLTEYDIIYAQRLSHKSKLSARDILSARNKAGNWVDVSEEVYSKADTTHRKKVKKGLFQNKKVTGKQMYLADNLSDQIGADVCDYLSQEDLEYIKKDYEGTAMAKIKQKLEDNGYIKSEDTDISEYQSTYVDRLTSMGLTIQQIENYRENGWDYTAIYNARLISTRKNIEIESVFSQMKAGIPFAEIK